MFDCAGVHLSAMLLFIWSNGVECSFFGEANVNGRRLCPSLTRKINTVECMAKCLDMNKYVGETNHSCYYHVKTGNVFEYFNRNCSGCMKLFPNSPKINETRGLHFTFKSNPYRLCGKWIGIGTPLPMPHENIQYTCGLVDETLKVWAPKDVEEIKCVIKGLPSTWQIIGKIGLNAFKSTCLNKFKLCDMQFPRDLQEEFVRLMVPARQNVNLGQFNGTCVIIAYKYANKNVTNLEFREVSCVEKHAPYLCEGY